MTVNGSTISGAWIINILMLILIAIIGFGSSREYTRNDDQEVRLRDVEQVCVTVPLMRSDITEIKGDLKTLLRKP